MKTKITGLVLCAAAAVLLAGCPDENDYTTAFIVLTFANATEKPLRVSVSTNYVHPVFVDAGADKTIEFETGMKSAEDMRTFSGESIIIYEVYKNTSGDLVLGPFIKEIKDAGAVIKFISSETFTDDDKHYLFAEAKIKKFYYNLTITKELLEN
jgi:hypothetical protein